MKNLPKRIFLNLRHTWQVKKGNKCLPDDFVQLRDDCGECITHTLGEPNHEDDPEYILNDKSEFVPEEWGYNKHIRGEAFICYTINMRFDLDKRAYGWQLWDVESDKLIIYSGPLNKTLYHLIAEANGIPIPEDK